MKLKGVCSSELRRILQVHYIINLQLYFTSLFHNLHFVQLRPTLRPAKAQFQFKLRLIFYLEVDFFACFLTSHLKITSICLFTNKKVPWIVWETMNFAWHLLAIFLSFWLQTTCCCSLISLKGILVKVWYQYFSWYPKMDWIENGFSKCKSKQGRKLKVLQLLFFNKLSLHLSSSSALVEGQFNKK